MNQTFNRRPLSVNTPSSSDVKNYFFNYTNWKGMSKDKNFLLSDQETFEDCNNIFVNSEGLLRSRPAIKIIAKIKDDYSLNDVDDVQIFNDIKVYKHHNGDAHYLTFVNGNVIKQVDSDEQVKLILADQKIFAFYQDALYYYDIKENEWYEASDLIYKPITKHYVNGILQEKSPEQENELTSSHRISYIFDFSINVNHSILYGKQLEFIIDNVKYNKVFSEDLELTFVQQYFKWSRSELYINSLQFSNKGNFIIIRPSVVYHSVDGFTFDTIYLPDPSRNSTKYISEDGIYLLADYGAAKYIINLLNDDDDIRRFENWTNINTYISIENGFQNVEAMKFLTYDTFCYVCNETSVVKCNSGNVKIYKDLTLGHTHFKIKCKIINEDFIIAIYSRTYGNENKNYTHIIYNDEHFAYSYDSVGSSVYVDLAISEKKVYLAHVYHESKILSYHTYSIPFNQMIHNKPVIKSIDLSEVYDKIYEVPTYWWSGISGIIMSDYDYSVLFETGYFPIETEAVKPLQPWLYIPTKNKLIQFSIKASVISNFLGSFSNSLYLYDPINKFVYKSLKDKVVTFYETVNNSNNYILPDNIIEHDIYYMSKDNKLYISSYTTDEFKWYFPKINTEQFDDNITNLHPISDNEVAVFNKNSIYYVRNTDNIYYYYKSKLPVGCLQGSDIVTSYDGKYTIFACERGLVAMSYQDFVASTEQALVFLSDPISSSFSVILNKPVKLEKIEHWIICYTDDSNNCYVLDTRNNSWWPMTYSDNLSKIINIDNKLIVLSMNELYELDNSDEDYFDTNGEIEWHFTSQKLYLNAINYYKNIKNITLYSVLDNQMPLSLVLEVKNYRKYINNGKEEVIEYDVDAIRTFIQRLNYSKVNEFQFTLKSDIDNAYPLPLSLSNITIKYKIGGQVR